MTGRTLAKPADLLIPEAIGAESAHGLLRLAAQECVARNLLIDNASIGIGLADMEGVFIDMNPVLEQLSGYTIETLRLVSVAETYADGSARNEVVATLRAQGRIRDMEVLMKRRDGSLWRALLNADLIRIEGRDLVLSTFRDITWTKKLEGELGKSNERFAKLFYASPAPIMLCEFGEGRLLEVNEAFTTLTGWSRSEAVGRNGVELGLWANLSHRERYRAELIACGSVRDFEFHWRDRNGSARVGLLTSERMAIGDRACFISTCIDITERKRSEEALRHSQRFIESILNAIPVRVFWKDRDLKYLGCNELFARDAGWEKPGDLIGKSDYEMAWMPYGDKYREDDRGVIESETSRLLIEEPVTMPGGEIRQVMTTKTPLRDADGKVVGVLGTYMDVTEHLKTVKALEVSEKKYRTYLDRAPIGVVLLDRCGWIEDANPSFVELLGVPRMELLSRPSSEFFLSNDETTPIRIQDFNAAENLRFDSRIRHRDGSLLHVKLEISGVEDGKFLCYCIDLTKEMNLQRQVQVSQRMEAFGQLAGGVAHDFNNLLQVISGYTSLAQKKLPENSPILNDLNFVMESADRSANLVRQLLAYSRRQALQVRDLDLNIAVRDLLKMLRRVIRENIAVEVRENCPPPNVKADRGMIEQVLMNLCVNSRDAMPDGGVLLIETGCARLDEGDCADSPWAKPGCFASIKVSDNGAGMDEETMRRIFDPFFTTKEPGKGTGLGLSTAYGIVRQHGGLLRVFSEPGLGSAFTILLPSAEREEGLGPCRSAEAGAPGGREVILLAEDEEAVRTFGKLVLEKAGYTVLTATNGLEAIEVFKKHGSKIDLFIADAVMPNLSGPDAYARILELKPELPVIYCSGYSRAVSEESEAIKPEPVVIRKPYLIGELLRAVRTRLDSL